MTLQFNDIDLARPAHEFLADDTEVDFASYYMAQNGWIDYLGGGKDKVVQAAQRYRAKHPTWPMNL